MKRMAWWIVMTLGFLGLWRLSQVEPDDTTFRESPYIAFICFGAGMCILYPRKGNE